LIGNGSSPVVLPVAERVAEVERLRQALEAARVDLERLADAVSKQIGPTEAAVFEAQALFLQDSALTEPMEAAIRHGGQPAVCALEQTMEAAARDMEALNDVYLSARAADLYDVKGRVARLLGAPGPGDLSAVSVGTVVIARDLTPSDTVGLRPETVSGIVLAEGTPTAHAAILARGLGLPLVVGAGAAIWQVEPGQQVILDGTDGIVLVEPQAQECEEYRQLVVRRQRPEIVVRGEEHPPARTGDGRRVELMANVSSVAEAQLAVECGAEGVGLLRTEFVLAAPTRGAATGATLPDEDELAEAYGAIFEVMGERPIVVRTMDAGGDKPLPCLDFGHEANPFLGWRGIRISLDRPDLFVSQTRAVLRAAVRHGTDLRVMFPMVSSLDELTRARQIVERVREEEELQLAHPLQIGVMIEVPAAALIADVLAREADFFSLGTNDLLQYTLACDRGNARVNHLCRLAHPAVLRLIDMVVRAAHAAGRPVGVCGEAAGDASSMPLLLGLGVDELSVGAARLPEVRQQLSALNYADIQAVAAEALSKATSDQVAGLLEPSL
jgi:phosphoenolpyruvate-protein phosphotransferase